MIYAIATTNEKLSHRFSQSERFDFYNEQGEHIAYADNPALKVQGCDGKTLLIDMLKEMKCGAVIVRKIGQKTLGKLLIAGMRVEQGNTRSTVAEWSASTTMVAMVRDGRGPRWIPCRDGFLTTERRGHGVSTSSFT